MPFGLAEDLADCERELREARAALSSGADTGRESEMRAALLHLAMRRHEFSESCDGCQLVRREYAAALSNTEGDTDG